MAGEKFTLQIVTELVDKGFKKSKKIIKDQMALEEKAYKKRKAFAQQSIKNEQKKAKRLVEIQEKYDLKKAKLEKQEINRKASQGRTEVNREKTRLKRLDDLRKKIAKQKQRDLKRERDYKKRLLDQEDREIKEFLKDELRETKKKIRKKLLQEKKFYAHLNRLQRTAASNMKKTGQGLKSGFSQLNTFGGAVLRYAAVIGGALAGFGLVTKRIIDVGSEFEQAMRNVGSILNVDDPKLIAARTKALSDEARELGATTAYTATEVARGMGDLARAGLKADKIIGAIAPSLYLAGGAGVELSDATKLMARTMAQFNLQARDAQEVADVFTIAMQNSLLNMQALDSSMRYAGSSAGAFGWNIKQTTAVVSIFMDQVGLGSTAGTQFRHIMKSLGAPTRKAEKVIEKLANRMNVNADTIRERLNPATSDFVTIMNTLKPIMEDNLSLTTLVNKRSSSTLQKILQDFHKGSSKYEDLMALFDSQSGQAERTYKAQIDTVMGQTKVFTSLLQETFLNIFAAISPSVRKVLSLLQDILKEAISVIELFVTQIQAAFDQAFVESGVESKTKSFGKAIGLYTVVFIRNIIKLPALLKKIFKDLTRIAKMVVFVWFTANFAAMVSGIVAVGGAIKGAFLVVVTGFGLMLKALVGVNAGLAVTATLMSAVTFGVSAGLAIGAMTKLWNYMSGFVPDFENYMGDMKSSVNEVSASLENLEEARKRVQDAFAQPLGELFGDDATAGEIFEQHQEGINRIQKEILKLKPSDRRTEALSVLSSFAQADAGQLREGLSTGSMIRLEGATAKQLIPEEQRQYLLSINNYKDYALSLDAINAIIATQGEEATKKLHDSLREQRKIYTQELKAVAAAQKIVQSPASSFESTEIKLDEIPRPHSIKKENLEIVEVKFNVNAGNVEETLESIRRTSTIIFEKQSKNTLEQLKKAKRFSKDLSEVVADLEEREKSVKEPRKTAVDRSFSKGRGIPEDLDTQYNEVFDDIKRNAEKLSPVLNQGLIDYRNVIGGTAEQHANFVKQFQKNVQEATGTTQEVSSRMASRLFAGFIKHAAVVEATDEELTQRIIANQRAAVHQGKKQYSILGDAYNDFVAPLLAAEQAIRADPELNQEEINKHFLALTQLASEIENLDSSYRSFQDAIDKEMFPEAADRVAAADSIVRKRNELYESLSEFKKDFTASVGDINDLLDKSIVKFGTFESVILQVLTAPSRAEIEKQKALERERKDAAKRRASELKSFYKKLLSMERKAQSELLKVQNNSSNKYVADLNNRLKKLREFFNDGLKLFRKNSKARIAVLKRQYALMDKERKIAREKAIRDRKNQSEKDAFDANQIDASEFQRLLNTAEKAKADFAKGELGFAEILAMTSEGAGELERQLSDLKKIRFPAKRFQPNLFPFVDSVEKYQAGLVKAEALEFQLTGIIRERDKAQQEFNKESNEDKKAAIKIRIEEFNRNIKQIEEEKSTQETANKTLLAKRKENEDLFLRYKKALEGKHKIKDGKKVVPFEHGDRRLTDKEVLETYKLINEVIKQLGITEQMASDQIGALGEDLAKNLGDSAEAIANRNKIISQPLVNWVKNNYYDRLQALNTEYEDMRGKTISEKHLERVKQMEKELTDIGLPDEYKDHVLSVFTDMRLQILKGYGRDINKIYRDEDKLTSPELDRLKRNNKLYEKSIKLRTKSAQFKNLSDALKDAPIVGSLLERFFDSVAEKNQKESTKLDQLADIYKKHEDELKSILGFAGEDFSSIEELEEALSTQELAPETEKLYKSIQQIYKDTVKRQKAEKAELGILIQGASKFHYIMKKTGEVIKATFETISAIVAAFTAGIGFLKQAIDFINKGLDFMTGGRLKLNPFELMTEAANELLAKQDEFIEKQRELDEELKARRITKAEYQAGVAVARSERGNASEVAKKLVDDMIDESVRFMDALIKVAPAIIKKLTERLPEITDALRKLVPELGRILDELFPVFIPVLTKLFTFAAQIFAKVTGQLLKGVLTDEGSGVGGTIGTILGGGLGFLLGGPLGAAIGGSIGGLAGAVFGDTPMPMKMMKSYNDTPSPVRVKKQEGLVARFAHGDTVIAAKKPQELLRQALQAVGAEIKMGTRRPPPTPNSNFNSSGVASKIDIAVIAEGRVLDAVQMQAMERGHAPKIAKRLRKASGVKVGFNRGRYNKFAVNEN